VSANRFAGKCLTDAVTDLISLKGIAVRSEIRALRSGAPEDKRRAERSFEDFMNAESDFAEAFEPIADTLGIGETKGGAL
jgi:hypothetical protein